MKFVKLKKTHIFKILNLHKNIMLISQQLLILKENEY
jgi:hypothetical protein